jgi:hypothetical protein
VTTINGVAETTISLERTGKLEITVTSEPAKTSIKLEVTIKGDEEAIIATVVPPTPTPTLTPTPTSTPIPTPTPTPTPTFTPTPTPEPSPTPTEEPEVKEPSMEVEKGIRGEEFLFSIIGTFLVGWMGYLAQRNDGRPLAQRLRTFLWSLICGLIGYNLYGLGIPGAEFIRGILGRWGAPLICVLFSLPPLGLALWRNVLSRQVRK